MHTNAAVNVSATSSSLKTKSPPPTRLACRWQGKGKSAPLRILGGVDHFDNGDISLMKGVTTGYLLQGGLSLSGRAVHDRLR